MLRDLPEGKKKLEVIAWAKERYGIERSQTRRDLDWLEENDLLEQLQDEADRRIHRVYRTPAANQLLGQRGKRGPPISFLKGLSTSLRDEPNLEPDSEIEDPSVAEEETPHSSPGPTDHPVRPERDGEEAAQLAEIRRRQRSLINDVHRLHIPGSRWTYFQTITPIPEWLAVLLHEQLPVGDDDVGFGYPSFISPKNVVLGGP